MASGYLVLILIFLGVFIGLLIGVFCHFCAETESAGRYYGSNENLGAKVVFAAGGAKKGGFGGHRSKCRCSNKFKGSCKACEGEDFVDDGDDGQHRDFSDFGGDKGLDPEWGSNPDPIRSALGNGQSSGAGGGGHDSSGGGMDSSHSGMMSDQ